MKRGLGWRKGSSKKHLESYRKRQFFSKRQLALFHQDTKDGNLMSRRHPHSLPHCSPLFFIKVETKKCKKVIPFGFSSLSSLVMTF